MKIMAAAFAVLMLGAGAARAQDCGLKQYDSIPLEVYPDHLLVPVTFGDKPEKLVLRLENAANNIGAEAAKALDLGMHSMPTNLKFHIGGEDVQSYVRVPDFHLGRLNAGGMEFLVVHSQQYGDGAIGTLGTHIFEKMDFELDLAGGKLNLLSPDHCPGKAVYWTQTGSAQVPLKSSPELGYIRAEMMLDGHAVTVGFSTAGQSRIGMNAMRRIFGIDETSPDLVQVSQDLLGHKVYRHAFKSLTADGLTVNNPAILVFDEQPRPECNDKLHFAPPENDAGHFDTPPRLARCFGGNDAILGLSVLKKLHIYVSGKEKLLYLTSAEAH